MKKSKRIWKILGATLGIGAIACIIPACVVSCGSSSNSSSNSTANTPTISSSASLSGTNQSAVLTSWTNQFNSMQKSSNYKQTISNYLSYYAKNLPTYFSNFANEYNSLTKPANAKSGYVDTTTSISGVPNSILAANASTSTSSMSTTSYWKISSVNFDASKLSQNSDGSFNFQMTYEYSTITQITMNGENESVPASTTSYTVNFANVTFAPTLLSPINDSLNKDNQNINVYAGWYMNAGTATFNPAGNTDSSISQSTTYDQTINLSDSTNPTSSNWIANPTTSGPYNWIESSLYSITGNDWGKYFENTNIGGYAVDSNNALIKSTSQITNPNANLITTLSTQSLNISDSLPSSSSPSSSSSSSSNSNPTSSSVPSTISSLSGSDYSDIAQDWSNEFTQLEKNSSFKNLIASYLTNYANDLPTEFSNFANEYNSLTNQKDPMSGYVGITTSEGSISETAYYQISSVSFDASSLVENSNNSFNFTLNYTEKLMTDADGAKTQESETSTVNFSNATFSPTLMLAVNDALNSNNKTINVNAGWYLSSGTISASIPIASSTDSSMISTNISLTTTDPSSTNWIATPAVGAPSTWMTPSSSTSLWYKYFVNNSIDGFAYDGNKLISSTNKITNPDLSQLDTLKTDSLNPTPISIGNTGSSSTSTDATEIKALESEINDEIKSLPTETQTIAKSALSAIESSGTSATTLQDLTKLASLLSNKNLSPTQLGQDLDSLLA